MTAGAMSFRVSQEGRTTVVEAHGELDTSSVATFRSALECGLDVRGVALSRLPGQDGNLEYFVWTKVPHEGLVPRIEGELDRLTEQALPGGDLFGPPDRSTDQTELDE